MALCKSRRNPIVALNNGVGVGERVVGRVLSQPPFAFPQPQNPTTSCSVTL